MMKFRHCHHLLILSLLAASCTRTPVQPEQANDGERYTISLSALHPDSLIFSYTVTSGTRFILPFHYFDNPLDLPDGSLIKNLRITDGSDAPVMRARITEQIGPIQNQIVILPTEVIHPVTFTWRVDPSVLNHDPETGHIPGILLNDSSMLMIGAYCFIIPELSTSLTTLWRTPHPVSVSVSTPLSLPIYGIPSSTFSCPNLYTLLFLQFSAGPPPVASGHGGGVDFVFIDLHGYTFTGTLLDSVSTMFATILDDIALRYGPFSGDPYTVSFSNIHGGLEGTFGFTVRDPAPGRESRFGEILAHEALHHFIGIRCGEYDDLWWKEAGAAYLGLETATRLGYYPPDLFHARITKRFSFADTLRFHRTLSDPLLRPQLFPDMLYSLVYERGAQIMMLLDVAVRTGSDNRFTLHHVMADLCSRFSGSAFTRGDFIETLGRYGATDAAALFATYVDRGDTLPTPELLDRTFNRLDSLGGYF